MPCDLQVKNGDCAHAACASSYKFYSELTVVLRDAEIANVPFMASAGGMQCQAQDAKFSQLNERIATTQCTRKCRQKWDICDFCIP
jgi:hypothetical protein